MTTSVLVVDDEALLRTAFSALIDAEDDLEVVGEAANGRQAVELRTRAPRGLAELTEREREVLALVAQGLSNAELAQTLHVTLPTAKTHVSRILTKLGARDRTQLVVIAYESGIVITP